MALLFLLSVECGQDKNAAESLVKYFESHYLHLGDKKEHQCLASVDEWKSAFWCVVAPDNLPRSGWGNEEERKILEEAGNELYCLLKDISGYRFAMVGIESGFFRTFDELKIETDLHIFHGLVVAEGILVDIEPCKSFEPFAPGYKWIPYQGE